VTSEARDEGPTFEAVAQLIAQDEGDIDWLADGLRAWVWPQERHPPSTRKYGSGLGMFADLARIRWSRAELLETLKETLPSAAKTIDDMLRDWALFSFLTDERLGLGFGPLDRVTLGSLLDEIRRRCAQASQFPELVSEDGKPRAGRNKALAPGQVDEKVACASTVVVAWRLARGKPPGPHVKQAAEAADLLFALGMAPAGRFDLVKRRQGWGEDPLNAWPPHFRAALAPNPVLDRVNAMQFAPMLKAVRDRHRQSRSSLLPPKQNEIPL
jgi:hypothetical protein